MVKSFITGLTLSAASLANPAFAEGDVDLEAGQKLYRQCASCHMIGEGSVDRVGPALTNVFGSPTAANPDFRYSNALKTAGAAGAVWDEATLDAFLANPREYLPGNRMSFRGVRDQEDRASLIAYLRSFAEGDVAAPVEAGFTVSADVLAIEGDVEYGEYLGSECKTCHQTSGGDDGIPNIVGLATADFVTAMHAYREKYRDNSVMQLVAGRLSDEEIAALAAYFKDLEN